GCLLPAFGIEVEHAAGAALMYDVDDRRAGLARALDQFLRLGQRRLHAGQRQGTLAIFIMTVDQHQRGLRQGARRLRCAGHFEQGFWSGHFLASPQAVKRAATVPRPSSVKRKRSPGLGKRVGAMLPVSTTSPWRSMAPRALR